MPFVTQKQEVGGSSYGVGTVGPGCTVPIIHKRVVEHPSIRPRAMLKITPKTSGEL